MTWLGACDQGSGNFASPTAAACMLALMIARRSVLVIVAGLGVGLAACGPHIASSGGDAGTGTDGGVLDGNGQPHTLAQLTVTPTNPIVELDLGATASQDFTVVGTYLDGLSEDLTAQATWDVANPAVGAMTGATLAIPAFAAAGAQVSLLTAHVGAVTGPAQVTVVAYRRTGASQDFFFTLPFQDPAGAQDKPLEFSTKIPSLDVFFLMDTTGSMAGEISNLQTALTSTVVPGIKAAVADSQFGVGALEDFPVSGYGSPAGSDCGRGGDAAPDQPLKLRTAITGDIATVQAGVNSLSNGPGAPIGCGQDWPEAGFESIYQAATGEGLSAPAPTSVPANHTGIGGVGFRAGTMPIVVGISDANSHGVGETAVCTSSGDSAGYPAIESFAHSRAQTKTALGNICARFVGIAAVQPSLTPDCSPESYMIDLAGSSGARVPPNAWDVGARPAGCGAGQCCTGVGGAGQAPDGAGLCPLVFVVAPAGTGVGSNIATGISLLARFATFDVPTAKQGQGTDVVGNPLPAGRTTADFLKMITPTSATVPAAPPVIAPPTFDATTFHGVTPGTTVRFAVNAFNDFVPQTADAQIFVATIQVLADGCTPLDARTVLILVPPTPVSIGRVR